MKKKVLQTIIWVIAAFTAPITAMGQVCQINSTTYTTLDAALAAVMDGQTIKLLANINYAQEININGKSITFDLNGYKLNVTNSSGNGLTVSNSGIVNLLSKTNGAFNVTGTAYGVYSDNGVATVSSAMATNGNGVFAKNGGTVTVTGDVLTASPGGGIGVQCQSGAAVWVWGNVTSYKQTVVYSYGGYIYVTGNVASSVQGYTGVDCQNGGEITIGGVVNVYPGDTYIKAGNAVKTSADFVTPTTNAGYNTYTDGANTVWLRNSAYVCTIGSTAYATLADALAALTMSGQTIKLLTNINYAQEITVSGKTINFLLNGCKLNVTNSSGNGINITSGGIVLLDPARGELNVTGTYGVHATGGNVEVTSATGTNGCGVYATGSGVLVTVRDYVQTISTGGIAVQAESGATITVYGNVSATNGTAVYTWDGTIHINGNVTATSAGKTGADCRDTTGAVTIDGALTVQPGAVYITVQGAGGIFHFKNIGDFTTPTTKTGYLTYTWDGTCNVWVKAVAPPTYALTVISGTGGGSYEAGASVTVTANAAPSGQEFDKWTTSKGGSFANVSASSTTFTMPANAVTVTATYKDLPPVTYTLTVKNGTGSGNYEEGEKVSITADAAPSGQEFDKWTSSNGGSFANANTSSTTFTMPANAVTVTANYKDEQDNTGIESVETPVLTVFSQSGNVIIESKTTPIATVSIYGISGQLLRIIESGNNQVVFSSLPQQQMLIVKIVMSDGKTVIKKIRN